MKKFYKATLCIANLVLGMICIPPCLFAAVPTVTDVTPDTGLTSTTTNVTITGSDFEPGAKVSLLFSDLLLETQDITTSSVLSWNYDSLDFTKDIKVSGNFAYVVDSALFADPNGGLQIIDVSNPANPILADFYELSGAKNIFISGTYAYVSTQVISSDFPISSTDELKIIDISDPANPILAGSYNTLAWDVFVAGSYAYIAGVHLTGNGTLYWYAGFLEIIDISDPANPAFVASNDSPGAPKRIHVSGNYAYITNGLSGLQIIDISNPANPVFTVDYDTPGYALGVTVSGNYAYVADGVSGLQVINISDPNNPVFAGSYDTSGTAVGVNVSGNYAYVADSSSGLHVIDVSDPTTPILAGSYDTPGDARNVDVSGNYAYVADWSSGLQTIKLNDPVTNITVLDSNTIAATFPAGLPVSSYHVLVTNPNGQPEEAYLYNGFQAVKTIDIRNNQVSYNTGDTIVTTLSIFNGTDVAINGDIWVAVKMPDGSFLFYPGWTTTFQTAASCINIPPGLFVADYPIINYTFPEGSEGTYTWYAVIVPCEADVNDNSNWLASDVESFTVSP